LAGGCKPTLVMTEQDGILALTSANIDSGPMVADGPFVTLLDFLRTFCGQQGCLALPWIRTQRGMSERYAAPC
jgi:hypothetical protein